MKAVLIVSAALLAFLSPVQSSSTEQQHVAKLVAWPNAARHFPRAVGGICPGGYQPWTYRKGRAPVCVQSI